MATVPASIRYKNPGAMWGGGHAKKWGAVDDVVLKDGQSNHIAVFPTMVQGAAAQFDLWRKAYAGMTLAAAIKKWSGSNSYSDYAAFLSKNSGIGAGEPVMNDVLASPRGLELMKQQARWEAGLTKPGESYPMTDDEWKQAQQMVFGAPKVAPPDIPKPEPKPVVQPMPTPQPAQSGGFFVDLIAAVIAAFKRK